MLIGRATRPGERSQRDARVAGAQRFTQALVLALAGIVAGPAMAAGVDCLPDKPPGWARPDLQARDSVMVFLHGLHGDGRATWTAEAGSSRTAWPCLVLRDETAFPVTSAYLAHYHSVALGRNPTTTQIATDLAPELVAAGVFDHANVTFVAHSMGGIVLARLLTLPGLLTAEQRSRIRLVVFLGTPAESTEAAQICARFGINSQCAEMNDQGKMDKLWAAWDSLPDPPPTLCAAEGDTMGLPSLKASWPFVHFSQLIVPEQSAHRPCRASGRFIRTTTLHGLDHSAIAKPLGRSDPPHRTVHAAFDPCVKRRIRIETQVAQDAAHAARIRPWFDQWTAQLPDKVQDWRPPLAAAVHPTATFVPFPSNGQPSSRADDYEQLRPSVFAEQAQRVLYGVLGARDFQWMRPVDKVRERIADGGLAGLVDELRAKASLRDGDILVALKRWALQPDVVWILAARPVDAGSSGAAAGGAGFGLVGVLAIRAPVTDCSAPPAVAKAD